MPSPRFKRLQNEDPDYLALYLVAAAWAVTFAALTPSALVPVVGGPISIAVAIVGGVGGVVAALGVYHRDNLRQERLGVHLLLGVALAYTILQGVAAVYYLATYGNHDRVALVVYTLLPILFLNKRRRFLKRKVRAAHRSRPITAPVAVQADDPRGRR